MQPMTSREIVIGGGIAFQSLADIQATLPTGDRQRVAEDAELLMESWATPKGGFIFSDYGSDVAIGVSGGTIKRFMYEEFSRRFVRLYGQGLPPPAPTSFSLATTSACKARS